MNPLSGVAALAAGIEQKSMEPDKLLRRDRKAKWSSESDDITRNNI